MEQIDAARADLGAWAPAPVEVVAPDPAWAEAYAVVRDRLRAALGDRVLALEHVGSTAVPGLWAKRRVLGSRAGTCGSATGCARTRTTAMPTN